MRQKISELLNFFSKNKMVSEAEEVERLLKIASKYDSPEMWEIGSDEVFEIPPEGTPEFISAPEMIATPELTDAAQRILDGHNQELLSIEFHFPEGKEILETGKDPFWLVIARSKEPTDVPYENRWVMWEVFPGDWYYDVAEEIKGTERRLYGEW